MVSTVKSRPNHYEVLGIRPTASEEEIRQAFAREISLFRPHSFGGLSDVSVAYETLRDPARRRAYDESIGLGAKARLAPLPKSAVGFAGSYWDPMVRPAVNAPPRAAPSRPEPPAGTRLTSAQPKKEAAKPGPTESLPAPESSIPDFVPTLRARAKRNADETRIDWKYPLFAAGVSILTVGVLGAWAGMAAGNDVEAAQAESAVTVAVPKPAPRPSAAAATPAPIETREDWAVRAQVAPTRPKPRFAAERSTRGPERQVSESSAVEANQGGLIEAARDPLAPEPSAAEAVPASLPLPDHVIARTLGRIGYSCGKVVSTVPTDDGAPGAFKVTCASGQSYRAAPSRGRYHFRRWGSR